MERDALARKVKDLYQELKMLRKEMTSPAMEVCLRNMLRECFILTTYLEVEEGFGLDMPYQGLE